MEKFIYKTKQQMAAAAAAQAAKQIQKAIKEKDHANIVLATGTSQFEVLENLVKQESIGWSKVVMFHLDEYIGLGIEHPASFRKYLKQRFIDKVGSLKTVHFIDGDIADCQKECQRLSQIITQHPIDLTLAGIGENGHLAFNDPPADFDVEDPYIIVNLDQKCRKQQLGEGWFKTLEDVPKKAISMSIRQIMKSDLLIITLPDKRKAEAAKAALEGPVTNMCPASILQQHQNCKIFLDENAASLLS
ncbi:MAG: glucosamine-6-phosphate deaminase [Planctomycetota bacterium]|nr:MAG: glucosamine-6-phosphate deaminase [Planctomycetota bacterium]